MHGMVKAKKSQGNGETLASKSSILKDVKENRWSSEAGWENSQEDAAGRPPGTPLLETTGSAQITGNWGFI